MIILFEHYFLLYTIVLAKYHHLKTIAKAIFFRSAIDEALQKELSGVQMRRLVSFSPHRSEYEWFYLLGRESEYQLQ